MKRELCKQESKQYLVIYWPVILSSAFGIWESTNPNQSIRPTRVVQRIVDSVFAEAFLAQEAGVALAAWFAGWVGIVATAGQAVVDAQLDSLGDDLRLGQCDQRRVNPQPLAAFDTSFGR